MNTPLNVAIGEPLREITVEPLELPEPLRDLPAEKPQEQPQLEPEKEPDHVAP